MNILIKTSLLFIALCIISQALIYISNNILFTEQKTQEGKLNISIKLILEIFIISTIIYYSIIKLDKLIYKNVKFCNEFIIILLCTLFTIIVFSYTHAKEKLKYLFKNNVENFTDVNNSLNTTWRNIDNKHYIFNSPTQEYWNGIEKKPRVFKEPAIKKDERIFKKYSPEYHNLNNTSLYNQYSFNKLYPEDTGTYFTTFDNIDEIISKKTYKEYNEGMLEDDYIFKSEDLDVGDKVKLKKNEDHEAVVVEILKIFKNNIEYKKDYIDFNVPPIEPLDNLNNINKKNIYPEITNSNNLNVA